MVNICFYLKENAEYSNIKMRNSTKGEIRMFNWNMAVVWLVILVACLAVEIATLGLTSIWFAIGALAATVAALLNLPLWFQNTLFVVVSLVFLFCTRPIAVKYFNKDRVKTNAESLIGKQAIVISEIDNLQGIGQIMISGQEWSARTAEDAVKILVGAVVEVTAIQGVKLIVREKKGEN